MRIGNLVRAFTGKSSEVGIVIEVINGLSVPPVIKVLWPSGDIQKEWTDDVEVVSEINH